ncbi:hypothetical protein CC86DRAFT_158058 [Ophiobolus disseminans]|uniref:Secreted protein n=1 Tax=Ophiobolus disseminans TaxID=1469910 RepID=A0A6A6ZBX0_9PLEO|nr:hypothetical protein CC86DRAFT_158058 [Ophiobolus disseminans]
MFRVVLLHCCLSLSPLVLLARPVPPGNRAQSPARLGLSFQSSPQEARTAHSPFSSNRVPTFNSTFVTHSRHSIHTGRLLQLVQSLSLRHPVVH